ncbi:TetR/AcrR family transcriptional regulator [Armatimonas sp.]|uniref:TetR/AcrR family transcriptional regulator n=1 Tax=Armatimonas sp. TaxID=1872638 RepID=UPI00286A56B1|nr:TetR/AcrR family transcriptional regulator [Armatimonas sp.]
MSQRTDQRRSEILQAAATCFIRRGFHQTSMKEVCAEAKLSPGLVYHYFESKEQIIQAIAQQAHRATGSLMAELETLPTLRLALARLAERLTHWLAQNGEARLYIEASVEASRNPSVRATFRAADDAFVTSFRLLLDAATHRGELPRDLDTELLAALIGICLDGIILNTAIQETLPLSSDVLQQLLERFVGLS